MRLLVWLCGLALVLLSASDASAHRDQMMKLRLRELSTGVFDGSWEHIEGVRDGNAASLVLKPFFPAHCEVQLPRVECGPRGLSGRVGFSGIGNMSVVITLEVAWRGRPPSTYTFTAATPEREVSDQGVSSFGDVARDYTRLGVAHIAAGIDHLLFVLGLLCLVDSLRVLLQTITAFTIAHSITLGLSTLGGYTLPTTPVESVIALSIALVAVEIAHKQGGRRDLGVRFPWAIAFGFGLLHGFGFAGALAELRLAEGQQFAALLFFNLGVELGQLAFVLMMLGARKVLQKRFPSSREPLTKILPYAMGSVAMYWCFVRLSGVG